MGEARFSFTRDDLVAAQKAWWMGAARWLRFLRILIVLTLVYGLIALFMSSDVRGIARIRIVGFAFLISLAVTSCLFAFGWLFAPLRARRAFREHKALAGEFLYRWSPEGVEIAHDRGVVRLPWTMLHGWLDGPAVLMLYQSSILFNAIPKRALAPGDLDAIVARLRIEGAREWKRFGLIASKAARIGKDG